MDIDDGHRNYKEAAQLTIAQMRTVGFSKARELNVDYCFSLDSDILPAINGIQCALDILNLIKDIILLLAHFICLKVEEVIYADMDS